MISSNLILLGSVAAPIALMAISLTAWRLWLRSDRRRSPLNFKLYNLPGDGLRKQIELRDEKLLEAGMLSLLAGPLVLATWALNRLGKVPGGIGWDAWDWIFVAAGLALVAWSTRDFIRHATARRRFRDGLAAECATAQNLLPLMADGCIVFHDFPADRFNIDHIVVTPLAVFAVETKSRRKAASGGKAGARVGYDGRALKFPTHVETKPVEQAKAQADWLRRFLTSAIGEPVSVRAVLALPGWYVDLSREGSRADVIVNNLRSPTFLMKFGAHAKPDPIRQKRIAHALAERYPALED